MNSHWQLPNLIWDLFSPSSYSQGLVTVFHPLSCSPRTGTWNKLGKLPAAFGIELGLPSLFKILSLYKLGYPPFRGGGENQRSSDFISIPTQQESWKMTTPGALSWLGYDAEIIDGNLCFWKRLPWFFFKFPTPNYVSCYLNQGMVGILKVSPCITLWGKGAALSHTKICFSFCWMLFSL